jgi:hypothetical protein
MKFANWDSRPAVMLDGLRAFAVLAPGEGWTKVDASDVGHTGADMSEAAWRKRFVGRFGVLDVRQWRHNPQELSPPLAPLVPLA